VIFLEKILEILQIDSFGQFWPVHPRFLAIPGPFRRVVPILVSSGWFSPTCSVLTSFGSFGWFWQFLRFLPTLSGLICLDRSLLILAGSS
jgi:hypothetical protein